MAGNEWTCRALVVVGMVKVHSRDLLAWGIYLQSIKHSSSTRISTARVMRRNRALRTIHYQDVSAVWLFDPLYFSGAAHYMIRTA